MIDPAPHPYLPGPITLTTAHRGSEPACKTCGRFEDDAVHRADRRLAEAIDAE